MKHIHLFLSFVLIFSTNLLIARGPVPTFGNTGAITICVNGSYYLNPSTTNGTFSTLSSTIASVNASGYVTGVSVGTTTVSLVATGGVTVTATVNVVTSLSPSLSITDPLAQATYKFSNNPQGPIGGINNYVGYNGYGYSSQARPTNTGFFRASNQLGDAAGCPYEYYIFRCTTCGTVSDNNLPSVTIGTQVWTDKNLDVTTYSDGTIIPQVTDPTAWAGLTTGAWCYVNNDASNNVIYGKLYNWYAVTDTRGLAPVGWHVPTDAEFTTLSNNLGGNSVAGNAMMSTGISLWPFPNTNATNSSGFSGLPGGYRHSNASFNSIGQWAVFWSSDAGYNDWQLRANSSTFGKYPDVPKFGFSVRLIKD